MGDGSLRQDLMHRLDQWCENADLVLALGTSLSGLRSDGVAEAVAARARASGTGLGLVIISLTKTPLDDIAALRIYGTLDQTLSMLSEKLGVRLPTEAEVAMASKRTSIFRGYAKWYRDAADPYPPRESKRQMLRRAQPGNPAGY